MSIEDYYNTYDQDGSNEIELDEFLMMLELIQIEVEERKVQMCFRLFDREENDYFGL